LISLLIHGALYDPKKAKLGFWLISPQTSIALEFASPFGVNEFPIIAYLGKLTSNYLKIKTNLTHIFAQVNIRFVNAKGLFSPMI
jgi:hypothetical protein